MDPHLPLPLTLRRPSALYIHIPFCGHRCPYCDFAVSTRRAQLEAAYMRALRLEASARLSPEFQPRTVFIGGGTPSELTPASLAELGELLAPHRRELREFSVECNPGTLDPARCEALAQLGVTRLSLGSQSLDDRQLETLGRAHRAADTRACVARLRDHGFENINLDLMFGVPKQTLDDLRRDLDATVELEPSHVSAYGLTWEENTPYERWRRAGRLEALSETREARMFHALRCGLADAGYRHYEISNYALPGMACAHNRVYWRNGGYVGLGNSAASHIAGVRSVNCRPVEQYIAQIEAHGQAREQRERLSPERKIAESAYLALRSSAGLDPVMSMRDLGVDIIEWFAERIGPLLEQGLLEPHARGVRLSPRGLAVADSVVAEFLA